MRTNVVLPAPLGPSNPSTVPRSTSRLTPSSARTSPNDLWTSRTTTIAALPLRPSAIRCGSPLRLDQPNPGRNPTIVARVLTQAWWVSYGLLIDICRRLRPSASTESVRQCPGLFRNGPSPVSHPNHHLSVAHLNRKHPSTHALVVKRATGSDVELPVVERTAQNLALPLEIPMPHAVRNRMWPYAPPAHRTAPVRAVVQQRVQVAPHVEDRHTVVERPPSLAALARRQIGQRTNDDFVRRGVCHAPLPSTSCNVSRQLQPERRARGLAKNVGAHLGREVRRHRGRSVPVPVREVAGVHQHLVGPRLLQEPVQVRP